VRSEPSNERPVEGLVSVVIPVRGEARFFELALASALEQTYERIEIIVVLSGNSNQTRPSTAFADRRVRFLRVPAATAGANRNIGARVARGEFITFLDDDDLWRPRKIARQVAALRESPRASLAYSLTDHIDEWGRRIRRGSHIVETERPGERLLLVNFIESGSNVLVPRETFRQIGGFDETLGFCQDLQFVFRAAAHAPFASAPFVDVLYRDRSGSRSTGADFAATFLSVLKQASDEVRARPELVAAGRANALKWSAFRLFPRVTDQRSRDIVRAWLSEANALDPGAAVPRPVLWMVERYMKAAEVHPRWARSGARDRITAWLGALLLASARLEIPSQSSRPLGLGWWKRSIT
jgi:glycosyltransferase involved in cell wall biosynthesis